MTQTASTGNLELATLLIDKYKADVNQISERGETALISAIRKNRI
jgi:ankyrin repeat protein